MTNKLPLTNLIQQLEPTRARVCQGLIANYQDKFHRIPGSSHNHQTWEGGYVAHLEEGMNLAILLHDALSACRPLPFKVTDVMFVVFLHDYDKLERFKLVDGHYQATQPYSHDYLAKLTQHLSDHYDYQLSSDELNALRYVHGEGTDYSSKHRVMNPLATLAHCCDIISARIWFDQGHHHDHW